MPELVVARIRRMKERDFSRSLGGLEERWAMEEMREERRTGVLGWEARRRKMMCGVVCDGIRSRSMGTVLMTGDDEGAWDLSSLRMSLAAMVDGRMGEEGTGDVDGAADGGSMDGILGGMMRVTRLMMLWMMVLGMTVLAGAGDDGSGGVTWVTVMLWMVPGETMSVETMGSGSESSSVGMASMASMASSNVSRGEGGIRRWWASWNSGSSGGSGDSGSWKGSGSR